MSPLFVGAFAIAVVSSLAAMPKTPALKDDVGHAGVTVTQMAGGRSTWYSMTTAARKGYCIAPEWGRLTNEYSSVAKAEDEKPSLVLHFVEKDGKASLERQRFSFDPKDGSLALSPPATVALHEVARESGLVVWAYRDGKDVVLVTRAFEGGYDTPHKTPDEDGTFAFIGGDGCSFAEARLDATTPRIGATAEITGHLPKQGTGKDAVAPEFTIYASLSRLSRDPEPTLAVRIRIFE